jgi:hypothetical protein
MNAISAESPDIRGRVRRKVEGHIRLIMLAMYCRLVLTPVWRGRPPMSGGRQRGLGPGWHQTERLGPPCPGSTQA